MLLIKCNRTSAYKSENTVVQKIFSIAEAQTIGIFCNSRNKGCRLQVVQTKAIAALTQFCDFLGLLIWQNKMFAKLSPIG